jgi:DNA replication protein DnaC
MTQVLELPPDPRPPACRHCRDSGYIYTDQVRHGELVATVSRCLCEAGQTKGAGIRSIDLCLPAEAIEEMWPDGVPSQTRTVVGRLRAAGVPPAWWNWTFDTYLAAIGRSAPVKSRLTRAKEWIATPAKDRTDLVLVGHHGTGKTGLVVAIGHALADHSEAFTFTTAPRLFARWRETYRQDSPESDVTVVERFEQCPILIIDELTSERSTEWVEQGLTRLVRTRRAHQRPTIMTLNLDLTMVDAAGQLATVFGPALYDTIRENAQVWPCLGKSSRRAQAILPGTGG